jgi:hypothetical protein
MNGTSFIIAENLFNVCKANGGITLDINQLAPHNNTGYVIGGLGEVTEIPNEVFSLQAFVSAYNNISKQIAGQGNQYVGFWLDEGIWYAERVQIIANKEDAISFAKTANQKAIYSLETKENIFI